MTLSPTAPACAETWPVLLASRNSTRADEVRQALDSWPVPVTLRVVASALPALRQVLARPVRLVIVDWALDGPSGQALVRQLARVRPALPVLAFDALGVGSPADQVQAWPWSELATVLDHRLLLLLIDERGAAEDCPS